MKFARQYAQNLKLKSIKIISWYKMYFSQGSALFCSSCMQWTIVMEGPGVSAGPLVRGWGWIVMSAHCPWSHWSPPPTINLSLTTWSPEWDVPGEGQPLTGCSYLLWGSLSWHGYPFADLLSSLKGLFKHQDIITLLRILFTTYLLCLCKFYIFSICSNRDNSMRQGNVNCH